MEGLRRLQESVADREDAFAPVSAPVDEEVVLLPSAISGRAFAYQAGSCPLSALLVASSFEGLHSRSRRFASNYLHCGPTPAPRSFMLSHAIHVPRLLSAVLAFAASDGYLRQLLSQNRRHDPVEAAKMAHRSSSEPPCSNTWRNKLQMLISRTLSWDDFTCPVRLQLNRSMQHHLSC